MPTKRVTQMDSVSGNQLRRIGSTVEARIDWDELFEEARAVHGELMLLVGLLLAYELLEAPLPDRVKSRVTASKRVSSIARRAVERFFAKEGTLQFLQAWLPS